MSKCLNCSSLIPQGSRFCPSCGSQVGSDSQLPTVTGVQAASGQPSRSPNTAPVDSSVSLDSQFSGSRFIPGMIIDGRYRLVGLLGRGGMGEVYRADDLKLGQVVALKFLPPEFEKDDSRLARLLGEVRLARQVSHPNVCRVHDVGEVEGNHYLSMEYVDGEDLASLNRRIGRLPEERAVQIARQLCAGLAAAHGQGILHRDLKPANVMIDGRGRVRITDFGLAGLIGNIQGAEVRVGTPAYMAPEQLSGEAVTVRSDIYALGLVLYELFTGKSARRAASPAELLKLQREAPPSPSSIVDTIDPAIERVILLCLESDPVNRPPSAFAVAAALPGGDPLAEALAAGETPSPEMVAASGAAGGLSPAKAIALLSIFILGTLGAFALLNETLLVNRVGMEKRPEVLESDARQVVQDLGHDSSPNYTYNFGYSADYFAYVEDADSDLGRWDGLSDVYPSPVTFWYRQSPEALVPENFVGYITWSDPALDIPGMVSLRLDPQGRLLEFVSVPPERDEGLTSAEVYEWAPLFEMAGLDLNLFEVTDSVWNPPVFSTSKHAWTGRLEPDSPLSLRVEAALYGERVSFFRVVAPWSNPNSGSREELGTGERIAAGILIVFLVAVTVGGLYMARRNLRLGRGDRKGASRLAAYVLIEFVLYWLFRVNHVLGVAEFGLFGYALGQGLMFAAATWVFYNALEPYLRRLWPDTLVAWNRILTGKFGDPLVGRDILFGSAAGAVLVLLVGLEGFLPGFLGRGDARPLVGNLSALANVGYGVSIFFSTQLAAVINPLILLLMILILRMLVRKEWIAFVLVFIMFSAAGVLASQDPLVHLVTSVLGWTLAIYVLTRFGVVAAFMMFYVGDLFAVLPLTIDVSNWYLNRAIVPVFLIGILVIYAFYRSLAGKPLLGESFLEG